MGHLLPNRAAYLLVLLLTAASLGPGPLHAQVSEHLLPQPPGDLPQYSFDRYTVEEGLTGTIVRDVVQARDGYLWLATLRGLVRFDGRTFEPIRVAEAGDLPIGIVNNLLEDSRGDLWAAGARGGGLAHFDSESGTWRRFRHQDGAPGTLPSDDVIYVHEAAPGRLLVVTRFTENNWNTGCISRLDVATGEVRRLRADAAPDESSCAPSPLNNPWDFEVMVRDARGHTWISSRHGLLQYDPAADSLIRHRPAEMNRYPERHLTAIDQLLQHTEPLSSILDVGGQADESVPFQVERSTPVLLVGAGEMRANGRYDYGWIEDANGEVVWEMTHERSAWSGGELRSRLVVDRDTLPPGRYRLRFRSDVRHSAGEGWNGIPPDRPEWWGLQVVPITQQTAAPPPTALPMGDAPAEPLALLQTGGGDLLIGTRDGEMHRLHPESGEVERISLMGPHADSLRDFNINALIEGDDRTVWAATEGAGLFRIQPTSGIVTQYRVPLGSSEFYPFPAEVMTDYRNRMRALLRDRDGTIWVRQPPGVAQFDPATGDFKLYEHDQNDPNTLPVGNVFHLMRDRSDNLWIGGEGLSRLNRTRQRFQRVEHAPADRGTQSKQVAWSLTEAPDSTVWVATPNGINRLDFVTGRRQHFGGEEQTASFTPLPDLFVQMVYADRSGRIWAGAGERGLVRFHPEHGVEVHHAPQPGDSTRLASGIVKDGAVLEDRRGRLWVGTNGGGLHRLDEGGTEFVRYPVQEKPTVGPSDSLSADEVATLYEDGAGLIWIGMWDGGLSSIDPETDQIRNYVDVEKGLFGIVAIHEDRQGRLWLGTFTNGLLRFDRASGEVTRYGEDSRLSTAPIEKIVEDLSGDLWLATPTGILRFDPDRGGFRRFDRSDGLPGTAWYAGIRLSDGRMLFGGKEGLVLFDPSEFEGNLQAPFVAVDRISMRAGSQVRALSGDFSNVRLRHDESDLTFEVNGIDFAQSEAVRYRYRLDGLDEDWIDGGDQQSVRYTSLAPGAYRFEVQARNADGIWSEPARASLTILPPWWRTNWAYLGYLLLFAAGVFAVDRFQRRRLLKREHDRARERELDREREHAREIRAAYDELRQTQQQLIQQEKMASLGQLTAGIAHEIKNPLNFINNFSSLSVELVDELADEIDGANGELQPDQTEEIRTLLGDLKLNASKIEEHGKRADSIVRSMMLHARGGDDAREETDLNRLVGEYLDLAYHGKRASTPDFEVEIVSELDPAVGQVEVVPQAIGRVLLNLIGNAFDAVYSHSQDTSAPYAPIVRVATLRKAETVDIVVEDNGPGVPSELRGRIFEPFYTTKPTGKGTGLGLSLSYDIVTHGHGGTLHLDSAAGEGARFTIRLPATSHSQNGRRPSSVDGTLR